MHDVEHGSANHWPAVEGRAELCRGAFAGCLLCRRALRFEDSMNRSIEAGFLEGLAEPTSRSSLAPAEMGDLGVYCVPE